MEMNTVGMSLRNFGQSYPIDWAQVSRTIV